MIYSLFAKQPEIYGYEGKVYLYVKHGSTYTENAYELSSRFIRENFELEVRKEYGLCIFYIPVYEDGKYDQEWFKVDDDGHIKPFDVNNRVIKEINNSNIGLVVNRESEVGFIVNESGEELIKIPDDLAKAVIEDARVEYEFIKTLISDEVVFMIEPGGVYIYDTTNNVLNYRTLNGGYYEFSQLDDGSLIFYVLS